MSTWYQAILCYCLPKLSNLLRGFQAMEDTTCHDPLKCNLFTWSLLPFPQEREREDQEHESGSKRRFFAKTTAIAECMSAWYQAILCYCLPNLSKLLKLPRPGRCYMPGPLKCNIYTQEFVKVPERERQGERIRIVNRGRNRRICANYCNSWVYVRHDIKQFFATIFQNCPNCWAFSDQD
jgi:hypothetical protein